LAIIQCNLKMSPIRRSPKMFKSNFLLQTPFAFIAAFLLCTSKVSAQDLGSPCAATENCEAESCLAKKNTCDGFISNETPKAPATNSPVVVEQTRAETQNVTSPELFTKSCPVVVRQMELQGDATNKFGWLLESTFGPGESPLRRCMTAENLALWQKQAQDALERKGYVSTRITLLNQDAAEGNLIFSLSPGLVRKLEFLSGDGAKTELSDAQLLTAIGIRPGDIFNALETDQAAQKLKEVLNANVDINVSFTGQPAQADLFVSYKIVSAKTNAESQSAAAMLLASKASTPVPADVWRARPLRLVLLPNVLGFPINMAVDSTLSFASVETSDKNPISLEVAMARGVSNSFELAISEASVRAADSRRNGSIGQLLPKIDIRYGQGTGHYSSPGSAFSTEKREEASIELRQPLFSPAAWAELRRQNELKKVAELERDSKRSAAALDSGLSFLAVLQTQGQLELTVAYGQQLGELLDQMKRRAAGGMASENEAKRVESRVVGAQASSSEARANLRGALSNYVRLIGRLPAEVSFQTAISGLRSDVDPQQLRELIRDNYDLQTSQRQISAFKQAIAAAKAQFLPRVDFIASNASNQNAGAIAGKQKEGKAMVVLTYTLFAGGSDRAAYSEAIARLEEQVSRAAAVEQQLLADAETTLAGLNTLDSRYEATSKKVELDTAIAENFKQQLLTGNRQLLDVLDAHQRLYESRRELLSIAVTEAQAFLRFSALTGRMPQAYAVSNNVN
jgi:adhesin transport system outer membrane protein